jgi:hypothetical protein
MVLFPLQREAAIEALELGKKLGCAVWLGADAVTEAEYERYGSEGVKVSRFIYRLSDAPHDVVEEALETITLHHPGETVWVQHRPLADPRTEPERG